MARKPSRKTMRNKCDKLWADLIKLIAYNQCEKCGAKHPTLNAHHIFSRSNFSVRWSYDNGVALCPAHHTLANNSAHKAPAEFTELLKEWRGEEWYDRLRRLAKSVAPKPDYEFIEKMLKKQIEQVKEIQAAEK